MAYFGVQYREEPTSNGGFKALHHIGGAFSSERGPGSWDRATYIDEAGLTNTISAGYWSDPDDFDIWFRRHGAGWVTGSFAPDIGAFAEILKPGVQRFETLFSSDTPEGVACLAAGFSDVVQEHAYWGGARDRIAMSQTDAMTPSGTPRVVGDGVHLHVIPHDNLCLIRS